MIRAHLFRAAATRFRAGAGHEASARRPLSRHFLSLHFPLAQEHPTDTRLAAARHAAKRADLPEQGAPLTPRRALGARRTGVRREASARRSPRSFAALALVTMLGGLTLGGAAVPAQAVGAGTVSVTVAGDPSKVGVADTAAPTKLTLTGSGFQSIAGGFGGIYVLFGWNAGPGWEPSAGGSSGTSYRYVADDPNAPAGYQLFVPFPGSSTEAEGNGGSLNADGTWSAELTIAGPTFTPVDADGTGETIDCTQVQCGIMTIGAHGVVNPANESFTPIAFEDFSAPTPTATPDPAAVDEPTEEPVATADPEDSAESADATPWIVWGVVIVLLVGAGATAVVLMRRRRHASPPAE